MRESGAIFDASDSEINGIVRKWTASLLPHSTFHIVFVLQSIPHVWKIDQAAGITQRVL